jgi:hypothetical protein
MSAPEPCVVGQAKCLHALIGGHGIGIVPGTISGPITLFHGQRGDEEVALVVGDQSHVVSSLIPLVAIVGAAPR